MKKIWHFAMLVVQRFHLDGSGKTAASLTYTSLLAIVPLIALGLSVISAFPAFAQISASFKQFLLQNMVPDTAGRMIRGYMLQFSQNAGKLTLIGTLALGVTALMLMQTIEHALNGIWHVRRKRPWVQRFLIYWAVLTLGPMLIGASLYAASYLAGLALGLGRDTSALHVLGLRLAPALLTVSALAMLYLTVPNRYVPAAHAWIGGTVGGLCFEGMKLLFSDYISHFPSYTMVYGAFAALPLFLLWIYLSWITVLTGATIAATLPYFHNPQLAHDTSASSLFHTALLALERLAKAQLRGETVTLRQLASATQANWDVLEHALDHLTDIHWVLRSGKGWALAMRPDDISIRQLFDTLVYPPHAHSCTLDDLVRQPQWSLAEWMQQHTH